MSTTIEKPVTDAPMTQRNRGRMTEEQRQAILSIADDYKDNPASLEPLM